MDLPQEILVITDAFTAVLRWFGLHINVMTASRDLPQEILVIAMLYSGVGMAWSPYQCNDRKHGSSKRNTCNCHAFIAV